MFESIQNLVSALANEGFSLQDSQFISLTVVGVFISITSLIIVYAVVYLWCYFITSILFKDRYYIIVYKDGSYSTWQGRFNKFTKKRLEKKYKMSIKGVLEFKTQYEMIMAYISTIDDNQCRDYKEIIL